VVYSLQKMIDPKRSTISTNLAAIDTIEKVDDSTVKVTLKYPAAAFLSNLAGPYAIIEAKAKASVDWRSTDFVMGTGPFKFKSYTSGASWESVKNPDYFKKGIPYLDGINITIIPPGGTAAVDALITGRLDMTQPISGIPTEETYQRVIKSGQKIILEPTRGGQGGTTFWFNLGFAPFKDVRVRKAIALMVDPRQMAAAGSGEERWGNCDVALFSTGFGLPKSEFEKLLGRDKPFADRVTEAQKLLADAGYANGFKMRIVSQNMSSIQKRSVLLADLLQRNLKIQAEVKVMDVAEAQKIRDARDFDVYFEQALSMLGDPDELMPYFLTKGSVNWTGYSNPEADKLWQQQTQTTDPAKRKELTRQIERILLTDLPAVPTYGMVSYTGYWPYVHFPVMNVSYGPNAVFETTWMDKH